MTRIVVLGGARSGKSRFAESLAQGERHYIATAQALDGEMRARIAVHRLQRGSQWTTHEVPIELPDTLIDVAQDGRFVLVDCLTLWLSNLMLMGHEWQPAVDNLVGAFSQAEGTVVLVSNEVGLSIVPDTPLGRAFRDAQGILNQRVAAAAQSVVFVAAGLPLALKGPLPAPPEARS